MTDPTATAPAESKRDQIEFRMGALLSDIRSQLSTDNPPLTEAEQDEYIAEVKTLVEAGLAQARRDAFDLVRDVLSEESANDRWNFLQYCLTGWMESGHTGFLVTEYDAGMNNHALRFTPGLPEGTERRAAKITAIEQGDEDYDADAVEMILRTGKVCDECGAPVESAGDGVHWIDWTKAWYCFEGKPATHKPTQAVFEITHETIELGLQRVRDAINVPDTGTGNWERSLTSVPHLGQGLRNAIIEADLTNDSAQLDIWGYTAIVEIALLGEVRYA